MGAPSLERSLSDPSEISAPAVGSAAKGASLISPAENAARLIREPKKL
jgi:hypothetical protein